MATTAIFLPQGCRESDTTERLSTAQHSTIVYKVRFLNLVCEAPHGPTLLPRMYFGVHLSVHAGPLSTLLDSDPLCIFSLLFLFSYAHRCHVCGVRGAGSGSSGQGESLKVL